MRKKIIYPMLVILGLFIFSGCQAVNDVTNSIDYVTTTIDYINQVDKFVNEAPQIIENAVTDPTVLKDLEQQLTDLKEKTAEFNQLTPPEAAQEVHDSIQQFSKDLETEIDNVLTGISDGKFDPQALEGQLLQDFKSIADFLEKVQSLQ